ncbi:SusD/RagB family nutrient-binding outer membrane lipoprotein [Parachryseolinea silvisoli]|jgi:hypothetical protein|uniref:SusD/RagB family nutrient-binding outer membrane lipoprotein n=1 Tax=Parachryseolinea silvisoli TaxID=2873601 RepID=UPI002265CD9E|nr:SusD/RagB family nutrient-binding outer membrane lipoprotein [Parachryseolinea silvisoli]MCD9015983.1 SusD/RagB family nutrient-binding outer membrane lipoprotein [Parachryseolinea silvisoli]
MKKISIILLSIALLTSCVDSLDDYNIDQKKAGAVTAETLYSAALKNLADIVTTPSVNSNNLRLYVQHWTTTTYLDEPRYIMTSRTIPQAFWDALYRDVLADLKEARRIIEADQFILPNVKNNQLAQIGILEVYAWSVLVNSFGDIPYSEALDINNSLPEYEDAHTIYLNLLDRLDVALGLLNTTQAAPYTIGFGGGDLLYNGKTNPISFWIKFGNSLKLKLAMVIADVPADAARVSKAVTEATRNNGEFLMKANADNARFPYINDAPNNNPVATNTNSLFTSRQDFLPSNTIIDQMNSTSDPRRSAWFTLWVATPPEGQPAPPGIYKGGTYGQTNTPVTQFSRLSARIIAPTAEALLVDYSEVEFLLAEAVERNLITGDAAVHYNNAITASLSYWGVASGDITTFLAQPSVAYATAAGDWKEKIGTQKWLALFNRGYDAWVEWRRLDAPALVPPTVPNQTYIIPKRLIYPVIEQQVNGANRNAAVDKLEGGLDVAAVRLFWDVE